MTPEEEHHLLDTVPRLVEENRRLAAEVHFIKCLLPTLKGLPKKVVFTDAQLRAMFPVDSDPKKRQLFEHIVRLWNEEIPSGTPSPP